MGSRPAEKEIRNAAEPDDSLRQIDRDGIQPYYAEGSYVKLYIRTFM